MWEFRRENCLFGRESPKLTNIRCKLSTCSLSGSVSALMVNLMAKVDNAKRLPSLQQFSTNRKLRL